MPETKIYRITVNLTPAESAKLADLQEDGGFAIPAHAAREAISKTWEARDRESFEALMIRIDRNVDEILRLAREKEREHEE